MKGWFRGLGGNVLVLGLVSFFTDVSSEMIYPLLPLFLTSVLGAGPAFLGVIEGVAESTAALLKLFSGIWADRTRSRKGLILAGYSFSAISRPLIAAAQTPLFVLLVRFSDRIGKGVRTSPRDALVADSVDPSLRGKAFGFHRSLDHAGAIVGPLTAALLLSVFTNDVRTVFWAAAVPGLLSVVCIIGWVREVPGERKRAAGAPPTFFGTVPRGGLRVYLVILLLFTLGNSSDAFLLLRAGQLGVPQAQITILWTLFHVVKMFSTMPFGALSDRIGRKGMIIAGWCVYALAYLGFAYASTALHAWLLFAFYGLFYGLTEGVEKALLADIAPVEQRGAAFGWYNFTIGVGAFPASLIFGGLWERFGTAAAFLFGATLALISALLLALLVQYPRHSISADPAKI